MKTTPIIKLFAIPLLAATAFIACKKNTPEAKKKIKVDAIAFSMYTIGNDLRGVGGTFMLDGELHSVRSEISPSPTSKRGSLTIASTDFVAGDSEIVPNVNDEACEINNPSPNTITFIMDNSIEDSPYRDYSFESVTLNITRETKFALSGEAVYGSYNLHQLDSATQALAKRLPLLYTNNIVTNNDAWGN